MSTYVFIRSRWIQGNSFLLFSYICSEQLWFRVFGHHSQTRLFITNHTFQKETELDHRQTQSNNTHSAWTCSAEIPRNLLGKCSSLNKESSAISEYRSDFISLSLSCPQFLTQFVFTGNSQIWGCLLSSLHRCHSHCLLCLQPFLWRTQRSVSLICVDLWPSTVSAGDVTHSLVPQFVELLFLFPLVI